MTLQNSRKNRQLTLGQYVQRRNGVPMGASGSLQNMLRRSFGAGTFAGFWQYWNPIWGYALGRYIYSPLRKFSPDALALILTFAISGALHDLVTMLIRRTPAFLFTPWFTLMALLIVIEQALNISYAQQPWGMRVIINLVQIVGCFIATLLFLELL